jgi:sensor histidine kinase YesM
LEDASGSLKVEITDNGAGEEPLFFERMLRGEKTAVKGLGIGVRNIHERLKRHFGDEASLVFKTAIGEGTRATVVIPLRMEKSA